MLDEHVRGRNATRLHRVPPRRGTTHADLSAPDDGPWIRRAAEAGRQTDDGASVVAERAPADVVRSRAPRYPRARVRPARDPEPATVCVAPSAVVMRRPGPAFVTHPRPAVHRVGRPVAVI